MKYMRLGTTGLTVSRIALGCMSYGSRKWRPWVLESDEAMPFFRRAIEGGINFFDTANVYSLGVSEEVVGRALREYTRLDEVIVASKVGLKMGDVPNLAGLSRKHIIHSCEESLKRLGIERIDLYQIHRADPITPVEEMLAALDQLVTQGKVLYLGASSMYAWQLMKALSLSERAGWAKFVSMQNHYNLVYREEEREMIPFCIDQQLAVMPWSPLARGFLVGNRSRKDWGTTVRAKTDPSAQQRYYRDDDFEVVDAVVALAREKNISPAQLALAWLLHKPGITCPIIGATRSDQLEELVAAVDVQLSSDEMQRLESPYQPHPILGHS